MFDPTVCWQYLVKCKEGLSLGQSERSDISPNDTVVRPVPYRDVKEFIERYEWLGNLGAAQFFVGLYHGETLLAASCFMRATSKGCLSSLMKGLSIGPVFQLCRGATSPIAPKWAGSHLTSAALRILRKETGAEVVLAYADPRAGELGVVYRAANAIYLGLTDSRGPGHYVIQNRAMHPRTVHRQYGCARHEVLGKVDPGYRRVQRTKKHRYMFVLVKGSKRRKILQRIVGRVAEPPLRRSSELST